MLPLISSASEAGAGGLSKPRKSRLAWGCNNEMLSEEGRGKREEEKREREAVSLEMNVIRGLKGSDISIH